jgi:hypothetical protein
MRENVHHREYRRRWLAAMPEHRVRLSREQYQAVRDMVLKGMQAYANEEPVNSPLFKRLRSAWSALAQVQDKKFFVIEVDRREE